MALSNDLISQFVNVTKPETKKTSETITYGTVVEVDYDNDGNLVSTYVRVDGAKEITKTPVTTTTEVAVNDRVILMFKNHTAFIIGCITTPSSSTTATVDVRKIAISAEQKSDNAVSAVTELSYIVAEKASLDELYAESARIENLKADKADVDKLTADVASIEELKADKAEIEELRADIAEMGSLTVDELDARYANIDFTNIGKTAMEYFYAQSGLIKDVKVGDMTITGELSGVTISGNLIRANTVLADKLVVKGANGLYYKLNVDGETVETEQTDYNSLNGQVIRAKSVTAEKIDVHDLSAFGATIGGFKMDENSISSIIKDSAGNTVRGIYLDNDGQINFGDGVNYVKYYKDENGDYQLAISSQAMRVNATDIDLCGDKGRIEFDADENYLQVTGDYLRLRGDSMASLYSTYYNGSELGQKSAVNVSPGSVEIYAQESNNIDPDNLVGVWNTSRAVVAPDRIELESDAIIINGHEYATNKILWEGALRMELSETAFLSEWVSQQATGIVLVFSRYSNGTVHDYHFQTHFVPKSQVDKHPGCGHTFLLSTDGKFSTFAAKYLYVNNNRIAGNDVNIESGTGACGITYDNGGFVLRYVIGV